jgi:acetyl esterase/lipase
MKSMLAAILGVSMMASLTQGQTKIIPVWPHLPVPKSQRAVKTVNSKIFGLGTKGPVRWPTLRVFPAARGKNTGTAVVICPGGGYTGESLFAEGTNPAEFFSRHGITSFALTYRLPEGRIPPGGVAYPLVDVRRAIQIVRQGAAKWGINPHQIGVMGFSAGGSVATLVSVHWVPAIPNAKDHLNRYSSRPDFTVLVYPVISCMPKIGLRGCTDKLLGPDAPMSLREYYSPELWVNSLTPPAFICFAKDDHIVNHANERDYFKALRKAGIPAKIIEFKRGSHAFGLGRKGTDSVQWPKDCLHWLKKMGFYGRK